MGREWVVGRDWGWPEAGRCDRGILMEGGGRRPWRALPVDRDSRPGSAEAGARRRGGRASRTGALSVRDKADAVAWEEAKRSGAPA